MTFKRADRTMHIAEYIHTTYFVQPILPLLSKTFITPNMITIGNIIYSFLIYYWAYYNEFIYVALGVQVYLFLDILDGNLARYAKLQSSFGAWLDNTYDRIFYTLLLFFIGLNSVPIILLVLVLILINLYAWLATYYIVPRLRKLKQVQRRSLKKWFIDRGLIIGMDVGTVMIIITICLLFQQPLLLYIILFVGFVIDILARLTELWSNMKREGLR
ncbi:CDP-alcohol phosphatidyltransferase family protein [Lysinibacillus sphaericus]|uniref:CDP-alcohol phosphatidyltransferase family protein n=1 Tax=Lysinibacillus sphaericus TaxID=1421 RepID=UPI0018CCFB12|nr:CDP-alcohol phosphatidyltransferase family protein [Lysinibacillus sphaericus]